uniref:Uncharacterized protein n=3 Tax=Cacopsylla melanoneura TaxID=428564 RepID=A0A8D9DN21_9HEMI
MKRAREEEEDMWIHRESVSTSCRGSVIGVTTVPIPMMLFPLVRWNCASSICWNVVPRKTNVCTCILTFPVNTITPDCNVLRSRRESASLAMVRWMTNAEIYCSSI